MNFYNNNKNKIIIAFLIVTILFSYIIQGFYIGTTISYAVTPAIPLVLYELIAGLMAMLGVTVADGQSDKWEVGGSLYTFVDNYLNDNTMLGSYGNIKQMLKSSGIIGVIGVNKLTKGKLLELCLQNYSEVEEKEDNIVIEFENTDIKNTLVKDILTDIRMNEYVTDVSNFESKLETENQTIQQWNKYLVNSDANLSQYKNQMIIRGSDYDKVGVYFKLTNGWDKLCSISDLSYIYSEGNYFSIPNDTPLLVINNGDNVIIQSNYDGGYSVNSGGYCDLITPLDVNDNAKEIKIYCYFADMGWRPVIKGYSGVFYEEFNGFLIAENWQSSDDCYIDEINYTIWNSYSEIGEVPYVYPNLEYGNGEGKVIVNNVINLPDANPFTAEVKPNFWDDTNPAISIPSTSSIEGILNDEITADDEMDIYTDVGSIPVDTPVDDVIGYDVPYDDSQVVGGLGTIAQWLENIWEAIQEGIGVISESTTADPTDPDPNLNEKADDLQWPDFFLCIWHVLVACIGLILRAGVFLVSLFSVEPDSSLLNANIIEGLEFFKNQELPVFGVTFWNAISATFTLLISIFVVKKANNFV